MHLPARKVLSQLKCRKSAIIDLSFSYMVFLHSWTCLQMLHVGPTNAPIIGTSEISRIHHLHYNCKWSENKVERVFKWQTRKTNWEKLGGKSGSNKACYDEKNKTASDALAQTRIRPLLDQRNRPFSHKFAFVSFWFYTGMDGKDLACDNKNTQYQSLIDNDV